MVVVTYWSLFFLLISTDLRTLLIVIIINWNSIQVFYSILYLSHPLALHRVQYVILFGFTHLCPTSYFSVIAPQTYCTNLDCFMNRTMDTEISQRITCEIDLYFFGFKRILFKMKNNMVNAKKRINFTEQ